MTQEFQINGNDYIHLAERSCYNNNYFQHRETGEIIFEKCNELAGSYDFYRIENNEQVWLGGSDQDLESGLITIHPDWI